MSKSHKVKEHKEHKEKKEHKEHKHDKSNSKPKSSSKPLEVEEFDPKICNGLNEYHLGTEIGRGGFAVVYQAFNSHTGQMVAVKRFPLSEFGKDSKMDISVEMAEIELMHELDHPNIVKYYDTVKTKLYLYIVLEFMENGSLTSVIKKFGSFSESLTAIYITQVLKGLKYLHDQGVLHRDIKGANILTAKDGMVKLADFGVAMRQSDARADESDLAGSPYWMAPEIVEMSTPTSACDIWSVGCVVIELITSKPPYFDLDPMSALFRIVSDDYPPFPEGISQALNDFLLQCFQKEPVMRASAEKLLEHPWLQNSSSKKSLVRTSKLLRSRSIDMISATESSEVIQKTIRIAERDLKTIMDEKKAAAAATATTDPDKSNNSKVQILVDTVAATVATTAATGRFQQAAAENNLLHNKKEEEGKAVAESENWGTTAFGKQPLNSNDYNDVDFEGDSDDTVKASDVIVTTKMRQAIPAIAPEVGLSGTSSPDFGSDPGDFPATSNMGVRNASAGGVVAVTGDTHGVSSLLDGMKMLSADSMDDWDVEEEGITSSKERGTLSDSSTGRQRLSNYVSNSQKGGKIPDEPFVVNLNSPSEAFSPKAAGAIKVGLSSKTSSFSTSNSAKGTTVAATAAPGVVTKSDRNSLDNRGEDLSSPSADEPVSVSKMKNKDGNLPFALPRPIVIPTKSELQTKSSESGMKTLRPKSITPPVSANHSTSSGALLDLAKYEEDPDDGDFGDFEDVASNKQILKTPRVPAPNKLIKKSIPLASRAEIENGVIGEDDFFDDGFDADAGTFSSKIKAFKSVSTPGIQRESSSDGIDDANDFLAAEISPVASSTGSQNPLLADKLRQRMKSVTKKDLADDDMDAFINYQYDDKDFKQNEQKDLHARRSKEVVEIMKRIQTEQKVKEVIELCDQLITIFTDVPEQRDHLITHHGVMPIIEMLEARSNAASLGYKSAAQATMKTKALYVLKFVNKLIEASVTAQEQLSLVGIIPTVMQLFDSSVRKNSSILPVTHSTGSHHSNMPSLSEDRFSLMSESSDSSDSEDESNTAATTTSTAPVHQRANSQLSATSQGIAGGGGGATTAAANTSGTGTGTADPRPPLPPPVSALIPEEIDPLTLEAASFIHQISSSSSLTLQMLIGAGGLSVLTSMVGVGATLTTSTTPRGKVITARMQQSGSNSKMTLSESFSPRPVRRGIAASKGGSGNNNSNSNSTAVSKEPLLARLQSADDPTQGGGGGGVDPNDDIANRMAVFQMGIDCVAKVFEVQASRTRDFCRLFVKLGLLAPLSLSFRNVLTFYLSRQNAFNQASSDSSLGGGASPPTGTGSSPLLKSALHHRQGSGGSSSAGGGGLVLNATQVLASSRAQEAEESVECQYSLSIANLLFKFSRSDATVLETMVQSEQRVIHIILGILQHPELRATSGSNSSASASPAGRFLSRKAGSNSTELTSSNLSAHNNIMHKKAASSPRRGAATSARLLPSYVEIIELLLKSLKNLSMEPLTLNHLETEGILETLLPLLSGPLSDRGRTHILPCIFNMCRINKRRQERVAELGLVPHLKKVITAGSPLRQFALPILFDLAHTSDASREQLWKHDCIPFFLDLLRENYWQAFALNSLAIWLSSDPVRVTGLLIEATHLSKLIEFFKSASAQTVHTLHKPLLDMMLKSDDLCTALGASKVFTLTVMKRLKSTGEAIVLRSLLKMLHLMHEFHRTPRVWQEENKLMKLVEEFKLSSKQVLVRQQANKLYSDFQRTLRKDDEITAGTMPTTT